MFEVCQLHTPMTVTVQGWLTVHIPITCTRWVHLYQL